MSIMTPFQRTELDLSVYADLSLNATYRSAMKGPVIGQFVFTYYVLQSVVQYFAGKCSEKR